MGCTIDVFDVMNEEIDAQFGDVVDAIYYAANNGANVINMSLGGLILNTSMAAFKHNYTGLYYKFIMHLIML